MPGGGTKSRGPSAGNRLWAPALSLIQIFRSHARASAHAREASDWPRDCWLCERCSPREAFQVLPSEIGVGFRCEASSQATNHDGVSSREFFRLFDFDLYSSVACRGKSNAMRGGERPGAGRPKRSMQRRRDRMTTALASGRLSPLDYMLSVMNDPDADPARRDRMAIAAAPYVHVRAADAKLGKKEAAEQAALTAERGTSWDSLLN